jgi:DNA-binding XRE family transcriptional regulator
VNAQFCVHRGPADQCQHASLGASPIAASILVSSRSPVPKAPVPSFRFPSPLSRPPIHLKFPNFRGIITRDEQCAFQENRLHASQLRDFVICPVCQLRQFERGHATCVRCHCSLGITYIDIFTVNPQAGLYCGKPIDAQIRVGGIIRRLRLRRGITQAVLASLTGIHRTYLSRAERGRVLPSVFTLMQIASALGVDKISLRIRNARSTDRQQS